MFVLIGCQSSPSYSRSHSHWHPRFCLFFQSSILLLLSLLSNVLDGYFDLDLNLNFDFDLISRFGLFPFAAFRRNNDSRLHIGPPLRAIEEILLENNNEVPLVSIVEIGAIDRRRSWPWRQSGPILLVEASYSRSYSSSERDYLHYKHDISRYEDEEEDYSLVSSSGLPPEEHRESDPAPPPGGRNSDSVSDFESDEALERTSLDDFMERTGRRLPYHSSSDSLSSEFDLQGAATIRSSESDSVTRTYSSTPSLSILSTGSKNKQHYDDRGRSLSEGGGGGKGGDGGGGWCGREGMMNSVRKVVDEHYHCNDNDAGDGNGNDTENDEDEDQDKDVEARERLAFLLCDTVDGEYKSDTGSNFGGAVKTALLQSPKTHDHRQFASESANVMESAIDESVTLVQTRRSEESKLRRKLYKSFNERGSPRTSRSTVVGNDVDSQDRPETVPVPVPAPAPVRVDVHVPVHVRVDESDMMSHGEGALELSGEAKHSAQLRFKVKVKVKRNSTDGEKPPRHNQKYRRVPGQTQTQTQTRIQSQGQVQDQRHQSKNHRSEDPRRPPLASRGGRSISLSRVSSSFSSPPSLSFSSVPGSLSVKEYSQSSSLGSISYGASPHRHGDNTRVQLHSRAVSPRVTVIAGDEGRSPYSPPLSPLRPPRDESEQRKAEVLAVRTSAGKIKTARLSADDDGGGDNDDDDDDSGIVTSGRRRVKDLRSEGPHTSVDCEPASLNVEEEEVDDRDPDMMRLESFDDEHETRRGSSRNSSGGPVSLAASPTKVNRSPRIVRMIGDAQRFSRDQGGRGSSFTAVNHNHESSSSRIGSEENPGSSFSASPRIGTSSRDVAPVESVSWRRESDKEFEASFLKAMEAFGIIATTEGDSLSDLTSTSRRASSPDEGDNSEPYISSSWLNATFRFGGIRAKPSSVCASGSAPASASAFLIIINDHYSVSL